MFLICSRTRSQDQFLHAKVQSILMSPHFRLAPPHFVCSGDGTAGEIYVFAKFLLQLHDVFSKAKLCSLVYFFLF